MKAIRLTLTILLSTSSLALGGVEDNAGANIVGLRMFTYGSNHPTSTGNQAITGVGFKPKAIIFVMQNSNQVASTDRYGLSYGFAAEDGTEFSAAFSGQDNVSTTSEHSIVDTSRCIHVISHITGADTALATLVSMDEDGFTLNWTQIPTASGLQVWNYKYMCIGGDDIDTATVDIITAKASGGSQAYTDPGFTPDALFFSGGTAITANNTLRDTAGLVMGFAALDLDSSTITQVSVGSCAEGGVTTSDVFQRYDTTKCIVQPYISSGHQVRTAAVTSFDANGYTLNWTNNSDAVLFGVLAIKGGAWSTKTYANSTSAAEQPYADGYVVSEGEVIFATGEVDGAIFAPDGNEDDHNTMGVGFFCRPDAVTWHAQGMAVGNRDALDTTDVQGDRDDNSMDILRYASSVWATAISHGGPSPRRFGGQSVTNSGVNGPYYSVIYGSSVGKFVFRDDGTSYNNTTGIGSMGAAVLDEQSPESGYNYGNTFTFVLGQFGSDADSRRCVIKPLGLDSLFSSAGLDSTEIDSLVVYLYAEAENFGSGPDTIIAYFLDSAYAQGTGDGAAGGLNAEDTIDVMWTHRDKVANSADTAWVTAGGDGAVVVDSMKNVDKDTGWVSFVTTSSEIQRWVANDSLMTGFLLRNAYEDGGPEYKTFRAKNFTNSSSAIVVYWTPSAGAPAAPDRPKRKRKADAIPVDSLRVYATER